MNTPDTIAAAPSEWFVVASAANGTATANRPAEAGRRHFITGVSVSANATTTTAGTVTVRSGSTTIDEYRLPAAALAPIVANFPRPYQCGVGEAAEISCTALGTGVTGVVVIRGFTRLA